SVCGRRPDPARGEREGGRGSTCTPARLWSVSKSSSRFAQTPPSWGMHLPGQEVRAAAGPRCCRRTSQGSLTRVLAATCKRKGRDFPRGLPDERHRKGRSQPWLFPSGSALGMLHHVSQPYLGGGLNPSTWTIALQTAPLQKEIPSGSKE
ncbi:hypothetical protein IHE44_0014994, partial [Lamprotornis superbus]